MIALLALIGQAALAGPGLTCPEDAAVAADGAEVLYHVKSNGDVHATYAMSYTGDAEEFGWLIPVFGKVVSIHDERLDALHTVREVTQPLVQRFEPFEGTNACGCASKDLEPGTDTGAPRSLDGVQVVDSGFTGHYAYDIVTSNHATALTEWFEENGFVGFAEEDVEHYLDLGAHFLLLQVRPEVAATPEGGAALPPMRVVYQGDIRYPARLARHAHVPELSTTLYVLAGGQAELEGDWTAAPVGTLRGRLDDDPQAMWLEARTLAGAGKSFVLTYGKGYEGQYLTRFDTVAPVDVHDTDVVVKITSTPGIHETRIVLEEPASGKTAAILLLPLAGVALRRRRSG